MQILVMESGYNWLVQTRIASQSVGDFQKLLYRLDDGDGACLDHVCQNEAEDWQVNFFSDLARALGTSKFYTFLKSTRFQQFLNVKRTSHTHELSKLNTTT